MTPENSINIDEDRSYQPLWLVFAPFLGKPPALTRRQWKVIGLIGVVTLFDQYDLALFSLALKQIQVSLAIPEEQLGKLGALIHLGALPAFFFTVLADRLGRRKIFVFTIAAYTLLTGATAFASNVQTFVILQFFSRIFAVSEVLLAFVVISEELDPDVRGWGIGALAALGACGQGLAYVLFSLINIVPMGWRALYLVGLVPLVFIAWLRRNMPETERFEHHRNTRAATTIFRGALQPLFDLIQMYPGRLVAVGFVTFLLSFVGNSTAFFIPKYFQEAHGLAPWQISILGFFGGFLGIFGNAFAGRLSDKRGRKRVAIFFLSTSPFFVAAFYQASGWLLPPLFIGMVFSGLAGGVIINTFAKELFPTSYRSTASGARMIIATLGGVLGLGVESALYLLVGSHWTAISYMVPLAFIAPIIVAAVFPETSGRALEEIAPERGHKRSRSVQLGNP